MVGTSSLPAWWQVAEPHEDIRTERFDPSLFEAGLGVVYRGEAAVDYQDPITFIKKTYLSEALRHGLVDCLRRLAGGRGKAVVRLQTRFGGGKTHALLALYHLVKNSDQVRYLPAVQEILSAAELDSAPPARVVVLDGSALSAAGRTTEDGVHIRTFWGELAYQVGGAGAYKTVWDEDDQRVAPGTNKLLALLASAGPALILMDEILLYLVNASAMKVGKTSLDATTITFLQQLTQAVGNRPDAVLVGSLPMSEREVLDISQTAMLDRVSKVFGRKEDIWSPVVGQDIYEVLRCRLFDKVGDGRVRQEVADAYWDYYRARADDFPREVRDTSYRDLIRQAYPFHPELIRILNERWDAIPEFQRTRGVLRLLALVVGNLYRRKHTAPLIQPAHVDLGDTAIADEVLKLTGHQFAAVIGSDISGFDAKAPHIDKELGDLYAREGVAEGLARSIFLYSFGPVRERGVGDPYLRLAVLRPDLPPATLSDARDRLVKRLWFLHEEPLLHFTGDATLVKVLYDREDTVDIRNDLVPRAQGELTDLIGGGPLTPPVMWPRESRDAADIARPRLVVLDLDKAVGPDMAGSDAERFIRDVLDQAGGKHRIFKNSLVFLVPDEGQKDQVIQMGRRLLAAEALESDRAFVTELSDESKERLAKTVDDARAAFPQALVAAYRLVVQLGKDGQLEQWDLGIRALEKGHGLCERVVELLKDHDRLLEHLDPRRLASGFWPIWPEDQDVLNTKTLAQYFAQYPYMPILSDEGVLVNAIREGVRTGFFGLGVGDGETLTFDELYFQEAPPGEHLQPSETAWLVRAPVAERLVRERRGEPVAVAEEVSKAERAAEVPTAEAEEGKPPEAVYHSIRARFELPVDKWVQAYTPIVSPLARAQAKVKLVVAVEVESDQGIPTNVADNTVRESIQQLGEELDWEAK